MARSAPSHHIVRMHIGQQEWRQLQDAPGAREMTPPAPFHKDLYHRLADREPAEADRREAADFLRAKLATAVYYAECLLPQADGLARTVTEGSDAALALTAEQFERA